ncbi:MAG: hypothetical protein CMI54_03710 [Parcubacteria group bacterium]|nr:hypothetical protein [Parcubacteria group bacterium]
MIPSKAKNILTNFSLLVGVFVFCFILAEIMIRLFFPSPQSPNIFDEIIGYKYRPNSSVSFFVQGKEIKNKVNSFGFLDEEHSYEKPLEKYRIVFIGDSFTEATNVLRQNTFPKILEKELNEIYENKVETINLGSNGFGTAHEYLTLKEYGLKFSPDLVILLFIENDLENNLVKFGSDINPAFDVVGGELLQIRTPRPLKGSGLRSFISNNLQFPRFLVHQFSKISFFKNIFINQNLISAVKDSPEDAIPFSRRSYSEVFQEDEDILKSWRITKALIKEIAELSKDNHSDFLVVVPDGPPDPDAEASLLREYPELQNIDLDLVRNTILDYFQEEKINYIDLFSAVQNVKESLHYPSEDGGHYNLAGHQLMAKAIFDHIQENNIIK